MYACTMYVHYRQLTFDFFFFYFFVSEQNPHFMFMSKAGVSFFLFFFEFFFRVLLHRTGGETIKGKRNFYFKIKYTANLNSIFNLKIQKKKKQKDGN